MLSNGREETLVVVEAADSVAAVSVVVPGEVLFDGRRFRFSELDSLPEGSLKEFCSCSRQVVDGDALGDCVVLRHREAGDRIRPLGMGGTRKLKDYFGDSGIPLEARDRVPIVASGSEIVWIVGYAVSEAFAVRDTTTRGILIEVDDGAE
jgi:tRNA(Ile)-lysidine synthetase-like protein